MCVCVCECVCVCVCMDEALCKSVYCVPVIYAVAASEQYIVEFPCLPNIETDSFPVFNFGLGYIKFFLRKLSKFDI